MEQIKNKELFEKPVTRRSFLKKSAIGTAAAFATASMGPFVRTSKSAQLELRWLGWNYYDNKILIRMFEKEHKVKLAGTFFDGNNEAYQKLRAGGAEKYDLVMADGYWPRLYAKEGLTQPVDYKKLPNIQYAFPEFLPPNYMLMQEEGGTKMVAAPNCWGGYGITMNMDKIADEDSESIAVLFNEKYKGHICINARLEENIALAGILVCHRMGTMENRPDGKPFNPYVLTDEELAEVKALLIAQKKLLLTKWDDDAALEKLMRSQLVWASPEWSGVYRRIHFDYLDGTSKMKVKHLLTPKEGGLGWVDTWAVTAGVKDSEKLELVHKWIDFRLQPKSMAIVAVEQGMSPTVDVRKLVPEKYVETLFLNQTAAIKKLYQFDVPPENWKKMWAEAEAS